MFHCPCFSCRDDLHASLQLTQVFLEMSSRSSSPDSRALSPAQESLPRPGTPSTTAASAFGECWHLPRDPNHMSPGAPVAWAHRSSLSPNHSVYLLAVRRTPGSILCPSPLRHHSFHSTSSPICSHICLLFPDIPWSFGRWSHSSWLSTATVILSLFQYFFCHFGGVWGRHQCVLSHVAL